MSTRQAWFMSGSRLGTSERWEARRGRRMRLASCCCGSFGMYGGLEAFRYIGRAPSSSQRLETRKGSEALERDELDAKL